jgi:hypothetical protein
VRARFNFEGEDEFIERLSLKRGRKRSIPRQPDTNSDIPEAASERKVSINARIHTMEFIIIVSLCLVLLLLTVRFEVRSRYVQEQKESEIWDKLNNGSRLTDADIMALFVEIANLRIQTSYCR